MPIHSLMLLYIFPGFTFITTCGLSFLSKYLLLFILFFSVNLFKSVDVLHLVRMVGCLLGVMHKGMPGNFMK